MQQCVMLGIFLSVAWLAMPRQAQAICGLDGAVREQLRGVEDFEAARALSRKIHLHGSCTACHLARYGGPRNEYGNAINTLLTIHDREDPVRQRDAGRRMKDLIANPTLPNSPTFDQVFQLGRFPASSLSNQEPPLPEVPGSATESISVEQARELVQSTEAESPFGILQLSKTYEITPEVAKALAEFRGDTLILGIKSLSPEVATELAKSQVANVWLHSVTAVSQEAAEAIVKLRGHLVLTSLTKLDSVPLAAKLAARPGALSFPYLKSITPEIATALARNERSLTLAGLTELSPEVEEALVETVGTLSLPNVKSFESVPLAKKLAAISVLLPKVEKLTVEQLRQLVGVRGQESIWGGIYLSLAAVTPEIAAALASNPKSANLTLTGSQLSDEALRILLQSRLNVTLQDVDELSASQIAIIGDALASTEFRPGVLQLARLGLPKLRKLDSAILADTLVRSTGFNFPGVTEISAEAAAALGSLPDTEIRRRDGTVEVRPSGALNFPSLEKLSPETAQLLLKKRWLSISFPSLQEVSLETVRLMARQTSQLTLGIPSLPTEFAGAFAEIPMVAPMAGDNISFPYLNDLSPEAARILVTSLNRGFREVPSVNKFSNSPRLSFGSVSSGFASLSPALATELAKYEGNLTIEGLGELPDESAAALASFPGPYLNLSGPAAEKFSPAAAASLAKASAILHIPLRHLDSKPLAERFVRQRGNSTFYNLETVSREAAQALIQYNSFFDLRALTVLDSPEMARRFVDGLTGGNSITLPALSVLSPEAAEILASGSKTLYLGLTVIDSPAVARALAGSRAKLTLPRLRAATPEVIEILKLSEADIYVLPGDPL
jgi:hypothetical protein